MCVWVCHADKCECDWSVRSTEFRRLHHPSHYLLFLSSCILLPSAPIHHPFPPHFLLFFFSSFPSHLIPLSPLSLLSPPPSLSCTLSLSLRRPTQMNNSDGDALQVFPFSAPFSSPLLLCIIIPPYVLFLFKKKDTLSVYVSCLHLLFLVFY